MKKTIALVLALMFILALAGCIVREPAETLPDDSSGQTEPPDDTSSDGTTPEDTASGDTTPEDTAGGRPVLAVTPGPAADAVSEAGVKGWELVIASDPEDWLASGGAAILPVGEAARIYNEAGGKIAVGALLTSGGWVIAESGESVTNFYSLAGKTVYVPAGSPEATAVFAYIAGEYGFEIGSTLMVEESMDARSMSPALLPSDLQGNDHLRAAIDLLAEWKEITGRSLWPGLCLVVSKEMDEADASALEDAVKAAVTTAKSPYSSLEYVYISGADTLRETLESYLNLLYGFNPELIGGYIPDDGFYR